MVSCCGRPKPVNPPQQPQAVPSAATSHTSPRWQSPVTVASAAAKGTRSEDMASPLSQPPPVQPASAPPAGGTPSADDARRPRLRPPRPTPPPAEAVRCSPTRSQPRSGLPASPRLCDSGAASLLESDDTSTGAAPAAGPAADSAPAPSPAAPAPADVAAASSLATAATPRALAPGDSQSPHRPRLSGGGKQPAPPRAPTPASKGITPNRTSPTQAPGGREKTSPSRPLPPAPLVPPAPSVPPVSLAPAVPPAQSPLQASPPPPPAPPPPPQPASPAPAAVPEAAPPSQPTATRGGLFTVRKLGGRVGCRTAGVDIVDVQPDGAAAAGGLRPGMRLLCINGVQVRSERSVTRAFREAPEVFCVETCSVASFAAPAASAAVVLVAAVTGGSRSIAAARAACSPAGAAPEGCAAAARAATRAAAPAEVGAAAAAAPPPPQASAAPALDFAPAAAAPPAADADAAPPHRCGSGARLAASAPDQEPHAAAGDPAAGGSLARAHSTAQSSSKGRCGGGGSTDLGGQVLRPQEKRPVRAAVRSLRSAQCPDRPAAAEMVTEGGVGYTAAGSGCVVVGHDCPAPLRPSPAPECSPPEQRCATSRPAASPPPCPAPPPPSLQLHLPQQAAQLVPPSSAVSDDGVVIPDHWSAASCESPASAVSHPEQMDPGAETVVVRLTGLEDALAPAADSPAPAPAAPAPSSAALTPSPAPPAPAAIAPFAAAIVPTTPAFVRATAATTPATAAHAQGAMEDEGLSNGFCASPAAAAAARLRRHSLALTPQRSDTPREAPGVSQLGPAASRRFSGMAPTSDTASSPAHVSQAEGGAVPRRRSSGAGTVRSLYTPCAPRSSAVATEHQCGAAVVIVRQAEPEPGAELEPEADEADGCWPRARERGFSGRAPSPDAARPPPTVARAPPQGSPAWRPHGAVPLELPPELTPGRLLCPGVRMVISEERAQLSPGSGNSGSELGEEIDLSPAPCTATGAQVASSVSPWRPPGLSPPPGPSWLSAVPPPGWGEVPGASPYARGRSGRAGSVQAADLPGWRASLSASPSRPDLYVPPWTAKGTCRRL
eukprot:TRINITY_DN8742_c0_g1_i2.p1 TRINITY_DN8742_c0_g1~~TRINITY_DN8742_c0_g1_i2.p1  ORF type:complete len:1064 (+),score=113.72 TRINITY_DN8742_c0_g1_i2:95-3286(+)